VNRYNFILILNIHNIRRYYWQPELINYPPKAKVLKHLAETTHKIPFISRQKAKKKKTTSSNSRRNVLDFE
jgi:hypothetical protein